MLIPIEDPEDPRVAGFRHVRERDLVGRQGLFIAEGEVVLRVLTRSARFRPVSLLIDEKRISALTPLLEAIDPAVPVYVAGQAVIDAIAGFHLHRGILALAERTAEHGAEELLAGLGTRAVAVGVFGISNHDNMGGIFRNAAAFGADAVLLDHASCDPLYRKAIRVSVGGVLVTPFARFDSGVDPIQALKQAGFEVLALSPSGKERLTSIRRAERTAVLFGTEGPGLDESVLSRCRTVRIPMAGDFDSLNVAVASGIVLAALTG